jgi:hypothetical protein
MAKDSHNSSRPPSTDPPWAKRTKSLWRPSGKRAGGQTGHLGETLRLCERPNRTVEHRPRQCRSCHRPLDSTQVLGHRRQQVVEVVTVRLRVIEHRPSVLKCRACGKTTRGEFAGSVRSGVQYGGREGAVHLLFSRQHQSGTTPVRSIATGRLSETLSSRLQLIAPSGDGLSATKDRFRQKPRRRRGFFAGRNCKWG